MAVEYIAGLALLALLAGAALYIYLRHRPAPLPTPFEDVPVQSVDVNGWMIRYHRSGKGPYLLLLHGLGANLFCWRFITPLLAKRFTVIAPDLPGF